MFRLGLVGTLAAAPKGVTKRRSPVNAPYLLAAARMTSFDVLTPGLGAGDQLDRRLSPSCVTGPPRGKSPVTRLVLETEQVGKGDIRQSLSALTRLSHLVADSTSRKTSEA